MKLIKINNFFNEMGDTPIPLILSNDNILLITFYINNDEDSYDNEQVITLKFNNYLKYNFGFPGEETIAYHPYNKLDIDSYSFYELKDSDYIKSLQKIAKKHPNYNPIKWDKYRHYILTFQDNMFECISEDLDLLDCNIDNYRKLLEELESKR